LTPHFDCCPETFHDTSNKSKWRPIQCFVSLTDNLRPNTGGFEAVPGFHREFETWTKQGRRSSSTNEDNRQPHPCQCVGEYTHINPTHDREILERVQHIPVEAGFAVFWDNRIPHGNAYRNDAAEQTSDTNKNGKDEITTILERSGARAVVYCSFLPDVGINRLFVKRQLTDWKLGCAPRVGDRWIKQEDPGENIDVDITNDTIAQFEAQLTDLGRKLLGLTNW
jgi:hypothetical protein